MDSFQNITLIITTSPIPANPSIEMIQNVVNSQAKCIIVCDGYKTFYQDRRKAGRFTLQSIQNYQEFKKRLKQAFKENKNILVVQRTQRYGFAQNIRWTMYQLVHTQFVVIIQHDNLLIREVNGLSILKCMQNNQQINYIGFNSYNFNRYDFVGLIQLYPKFVDDLHMKINPKEQLRQFRRYGKQQIINFYYQKFGIPLFPLVFWYDRIHIARKSFYLNQIFGKHKVNNFVEDTYGGQMSRIIKDQGIKGFEKMRSYIYLADNDQMIRHLDGKKKGVPKNIKIDQIKKQKLQLKQKKQKQQSQIQIQFDNQLFCQQQI